MLVMKLQSSCSSPTTITSNIHSSGSDDVDVTSNYNDNSDLLTMKLYKPCDIGLNDVLCGRDKSAFNNIGNKRFRIQVSLSLERYLDASSRKAKSKVIKSVVIMIQQNGGRFLQQVNVKNSSSRKQEDEQIYYMELNEKQAHEKAGHALRDMALARHNHQCQMSNNSNTSITTKAKKSKKQRLNNDVKEIPKVNHTDEILNNTNTTFSSQTSFSMDVDGDKELNLLNQILPNELSELHVNLDEYYKYDDHYNDPANDLIDNESIFNLLVQQIANGDDTTTVTTRVLSPVELSSESTGGVCNSYYVGQQEQVVSVPIVSTTSCMDHTSSTTNNNNSSMVMDQEQQQHFSNIDPFATSINDRVVSWLIGESDSILNLFDDH